MDNLKQVYNQIARHYARERGGWPMMKRWAEEVENGERLLDAGCGEGRILQCLKAKVDYTGIDFSEKLLELAEEKHKGRNRKFVKADVTKDAAWNDLKKFDKIFMVAVLHHLPSKREQLYVLKKIKSHLERNGKVYISFWNLWQRKFWGEHFKSLKLKLGGLPESVRWVNIPFANTGLKRFYFAGGKQYWERLLIQAGWKNAKLKFDKNKKNIWTVLG